MDGSGGSGGRGAYYFVSEYHDKNIDAVHFIFHVVVAPYSLKEAFSHTIDPHSSIRNNKLLPECACRVLYCKIERRGLFNVLFALLSEKETGEELKRVEGLYAIRLRDRDHIPGGQSKRTGSFVRPFVFFTSTSKSK